MESQKSTFEINHTIVSGLPRGWGNGVLLLKDGKKVLIQRGRVVEKNTRMILEQFEEKEGVLENPKRTFDGETEVEEWDQASECTFCAMICAGNCDEAIEV